MVAAISLSPIPQLVGNGVGDPAALPDVLWDKLLDLIEEGRVIPVIGEGLLSVTTEGRDVPLTQFLATRLADRLGVTFTKTGAEDPLITLNEVAGRYLAQSNRPDIGDIYSGLKAIWSKQQAAGLVKAPKALTDLANIRHFKLFVTTTFDPLLEDVLKERADGPPLVLSYSPGNFKDLPNDLDDLRSPVIFHLLGRLSSVQEYAVTEEDALEFFHALQVQVRDPGRFFSEMRRRYLLVIGCGFSDWLVRFFLRLAKPERLSRSRTKTDYIIEHHSTNGTLVTFLDSFSAGTKVLATEPAAFATALATKWAERHGSEASERTDESTPSSRGTLSTRGFKRGSVFLSYASEDHEKARHIRGQLDREGIDAWFDQDELRVGQRWAREIESAIQESALLILLLSQHCVTTERRYFRTEWTFGLTENTKASFAHPFILPISIDTHVSAEHPEFGPFQNLQWERLVDGLLSPSVIDRIKRDVREYHRSRRGRG